MFAVTSAYLLLERWFFSTVVSSMKSPMDAFGPFVTDDAAKAAEPLLVVTTSQSP